MPISISPITEADIPGAVTAIQQAFADDPYNLWVYNDRSKVSVLSNSLFSFFFFVLHTNRLLYHCLLAQSETARHFIRRQVEWMYDIGLIVWWDSTVLIYALDFNKFGVVGLNCETEDEVETV